MFIHPNDLVLFQGDSITDCGRVRDQGDPQNSYRLGHGYALMAAAALGDRRAGDGLRFENRGISGEGIRELAARWDEDCLALQPNVVSLLVGINDEWRGVYGEEWAADYRALLARTRAALPAVRFVLCDPFLLHVRAEQDEWHPRVAERRRLLAALAAEFDARTVAFQAVFDAALAEAPAAYWCWDGVHPTAAGHHRLAQAWLKAVE
jgi:lysophospholipase L1-like esterase